MKNTSKTRKLTLHRETVRRLDDHQLRTARGGARFTVLTDFLTDPCTLGASCGPLCPGPYTGN